MNTCSTYWVEAWRISNLELWQPIVLLAILMFLGVPIAYAVFLQREHQKTLKPADLSPFEAAFLYDNIQPNTTPDRWVMIALGIFMSLMLIAALVPIFAHFNLWPRMQTEGKLVILKPDEPNPPAFKFGAENVGEGRACLNNRCWSLAARRGDAGALYRFAYSVSFIEGRYTRITSGPGWMSKPVRTEICVQA
jgi:hypothetical protein